MKYTLTSLAVALALTGCNGSDSGSGNNTADLTYSVSGEITSAVAKDSTVCADLNHNFICDSSDPSATAQSGRFTITSLNKNILTAPLVTNANTGVQAASHHSLQAANSATSQNTATLAAPGQKKTTGNVINGVTTILAGSMENGLTLADAETKLKDNLTAIGITPPDALLSNTTDSSLATIEANMVSISNQIPENEAYLVLAALSSTVIANKAVLTSQSPSEAEISQMITDTKSAVYSVINDTGVTRYFSDAGEEQATPQADYPGQDAEYGLDKTDVNPNTNNGFKFTKLDAKGTPVADDASEWSCVKDERTGLVWEVKSNDVSSIHYKDRTFTLEIPGAHTSFSKDIAEATCKTAGDEVCTTQNYIDHLNTNAYCGKTDWNLPTNFNIYNLLDFGETEKDSNGKVYGFTLKYFPNQPTGSPDIGEQEGELWSSGLYYPEYGEYVKGEKAFNYVKARGAVRGEITSIQVYSDKTPQDNDYSYLFPARLVSVEGKK